MSTDLERLKIKKPTSQPKANSREAVDGLDGVDDTVQIYVQPHVPETPLAVDPAKPTRIKIIKKITLVVDGMRQVYSERDVLTVADYGPGKWKGILEQLDEQPGHYSVI